MMQMLRITVDGRELEVAKGELLIDSLRKELIEIPHFCYHPALGKDGNCRMCMVSIEGQKRPQIACDTPVKDGMIVETKNNKIMQVRKDILELELINHPIDCPVCDQAGECKLQDYYMESGFYNSRMNVEKNHALKKLDLGKNVILDQERCVLCTRCVRFTKQITKTNELGVLDRSDHSVISTFPGKELESDYSMNIVDLCPVGALTNKDFRFKQRVWFLDSFNAICKGCSKGCNITVDHNKQKYKDDKIFRFRPRVNEQVNGYFICDYGRMSYKEEDENRLEESLLAKKVKSDKEINKALASKIKKHKGKILFLLSPMLSNEELEFLKEFALKIKASISGFSKQYIDKSFADDMLKTSDLSPNRTGMKKLGITETKVTFDEALAKSTLVCVFENNYFEDKMELLKKKEVISGFSHICELSKQASISLALPSFLEKDGTYINCDKKVQSIKTGMNKNNPNIDLISRFQAIKTLV